MTPTAHHSATAPATPREPSGRFALMPYLERLFLTFCVYTLSIGPMYWHWVAGREAKGSLWIAAFYEPLRILGEAFPLFGEWLNWYVRLWIL